MINDQIVNAETGEIQIVTVSENELEKREAEALANAIKHTEAETAKAALFAKLGLTAEEAALLLGAN